MVHLDADNQFKWELHERMVIGLRRACLGAMCISLVAFGDEVLLRSAGLSNDRIDASAERLAVPFLVGLALYLYVRSQGLHTRRPYFWSCVLLQVVCAVDGLCAAPSGGLLSPFAYGIVALIMTWPLLVPGGLRLAALPVMGGFACYQLAFWSASHSHPSLSRLVAIGVFQLASIVTALVAAEMFERSWVRIAEAAQVDLLTGLMSRRFLFERLEQIWRLRGRRDMSLALVLVDVDHLKTVNDRHGHAAGDEMLRVVSSAVSTVIRNTDFAGRLGGDEFVLVLLGCEGPMAIEVIDRLRHRVAATPLLFHGTTIRVTISAGVAAVPLADHRDVARVLRDADAALYQSKAGGRDRTSLSAAG